MNCKGTFESLFDKNEQEQIGRFYSPSVISSAGERKGKKGRGRNAIQSEPNTTRVNDGKKNEKVVLRL